MNQPVLVFDAQSPRVGIRRPRDSDCQEFTALMRTSQEFHYPWVDPPRTVERYNSYLESRGSQFDDAFLICDCHVGSILGAINLNCIVRGLFQSAYLGFYIAAPFAKKGYMTEGLTLVTRFAFTNLALHRLEANIQPRNLASISTVRKVGFCREGYSPKYLRIFGQWQDHERWAILAADEATP